MIRVRPSPTTKRIRTEYEPLSLASTMRYHTAKNALYHSYKGTAFGLKLDITLEKYFPKILIKLNRIRSVSEYSTNQINNTPPRILLPPPLKKVGKDASY